MFGLQWSTRRLETRASSRRGRRAGRRGARCSGLQWSTRSARERRWPRDESTEPDVEAHGDPDSNEYSECSRHEGVLAASDEEPDVEAHGVRAGRCPVYVWRARAGRVGTELCGPRHRRPGFFMRRASSRGGSGAGSRPRAARPRERRRRSRDARRPELSASVAEEHVRPPRALSRRSTAIAAWFANRPRSSISCRLKSVCSGRSRTESTPSAPSSCRSGAAISPLGTYPVSLGDVAREPWIVPDVLDDERRPSREHPAGDARPSGEARPEQRVLALADDRLEDELLRLLVEEKDRRRLGAEDRASDLDDRGEERAERLLRADDACGDGCAQIRLFGHVPPPTFVAVR